MPGEIVNGEFKHPFCQQNGDFYGYTVFEFEGVKFVTLVDANHVIDKINKNNQFTKAGKCRRK